MTVSDLIREHPHLSARELAAKLGCQPAYVRAVRGRDRYAEDPDYRERQKAWSRAYARRRYAEDPEYRERQKARVLAYARRRRAANRQIATEVRP